MAIDDGDYYKARSYLTSTILDNFTQSDCTRQMEEFDKLGGINNINITKEEIKDDVAQVHFDIEFTNGFAQRSLALILTKVDGKWKIYRTFF